MKRGRITAFLLAAVMLTGSLSHTVFAADKSAVTNVTTAKGWDLLRSRYITYTINGVKYDSREMGAGTNYAAYNSMSDADKEKVARWMAGAWPSDRIRMFGNNGADAIIDKYNTVTGWKSLWAETSKKIENYYSGDLLKVYGGPSTSEPDKYFEQEYKRLDTLDENSTAYKVLNTEYSHTFQARDLVRKKRYIGELMNEGRGYYKQLSQNMMSATQAAVKGSSKELISIVCDKMLVPVITPRSMFSTIEKEVFSGLLEISDKITGVTGQIQDTVLGEPISGSGAAKLAQYFKTLANENYNAAKYCHDKANNIYNNLDRDAADTVLQVEAARSHRVENGRDGQVEEYNKKRDAQTQALNDSLSPTPNTAAAMGIYNMYPKYMTTDENREQYMREYRAAQAAEQKAVAQMYSDVSSWSRNVHSQARAILDSAGLIGVKAGTEITRDMMENAPGAYIIGTTAGGEEYISDYKVFPYTKDTTASKLGQELYDYRFEEIFGRIYAITPDDFAQIMEDKDDYAKYLERKNNMYAVISDCEGAFMQDFISKNTSLTARLKGWNTVSAQVGTAYVSSLPQDGAMWVSGDYYGAWKAESVISSLADKKDLWKTEDSITDVENNFLWLTEMYQETTANEQCYAEAAKKYKERFMLAYKDWQESELAKLQFAENGLPFGAYAQADNAGGTISLYDADSDTEIKPLNEYTPEQYSNMAGSYKSAYERYYMLEAKAEKAETELNFIFSPLRSAMFDEPNIYKKFDKETTDALDDVSNKQYDRVYSLSGRASSAVNYLAPLWRDFDSKNMCTIAVKNKLEKLNNEAPNMKRRILNGTLTKDGVEYYFSRGIESDIAYAKEHSYMAANMVTDGKTVNMEEQTAAIKKELLALFDDKSSYIPAEGINAGSESDISLDAGETQTLSAAVYPADASDGRIIWESSDTDVVSVDENGKITAVSDGTATIRAYPADSETRLVSSADYGSLSPDVYEPLPQYMTEFTVTVRGGASAFVFGDADGDDMITASDATAVMQKTLIDSMQLPLQSKTDDWLKY
ncbi:MAG: Ig-like domain-containing protein, partial [Firmicutes bacterium]|nr:Ig-like domain-containing protein [Bacillota bacterium]